MKALLLAALLAYIPSSGSLLQRAAARAEGSRSREVTLTGSLTVAGGPAQTAKLTLRLPLHCRLEHADGAAITVKGAAGQPEGGSTGPAVTLLSMACPLIAYRGLGTSAAEQALATVAHTHGADVSTDSSLSRLFDRVVYVLGASARETTKPQLWLYKDSAAPARLIAQNGADLRLLEYGSPAAADWFPRVLELWQDGRRTARFEVIEAHGLKAVSEEEDDTGE